MNNYDLSVIIPVYNCEKYIVKCVQSIINQKNNLIEIIIINDGSRDKTLEECRKLENQCNNIKVINQENKGVSYSRNIGMENANGKYIMFLDADDSLEENSLEKIQELILENIDVLRYSYNVKTKNKNVKVVFEKKTINLLADRNAFFKEYFQTTNQNMIWGQVIKKELLHDIKLNNDIFYGEDLLFNCQLYSKCKNIKYTDTILYNYEQSEGSITKNYKNSKVKSKIENLIFVFNEIAEQDKEERLTNEIENKFLDEIIPQMMMLTFDKETSKKEVLKQYEEILNNKIFEKIFKDINENELTMCRYNKAYYFMKNKDIKKLYIYAKIYKKLKMMQQFIKSTF